MGQVLHGSATTTEAIRREIHCNDLAVSAQVTLLIGMLRLVFSFRGPGVAFGCYKSGSSLLWLLRHAECSRSDDGGRIALSASE